MSGSFKIRRRAAHIDHRDTVAVYHRGLRVACRCEVAAACCADVLRNIARVRVCRTIIKEIVSYVSYVPSVAILAQRPSWAVTTSSQSTNFRSRASMTFEFDDKEDEAWTGVLEASDPLSSLKSELVDQQSRTVEVDQTAPSTPSMDVKVCPLPNCKTVKKSGKKYCAPHHRSYENCERTVFPGGKPKMKAKSKAKAKAKTMTTGNKEEAELESSPQETDEQQAFYVIFGRHRTDEGEPARAEAALDEYRRLFGDDIAKSSGVKKGVIKLTSFASSEGARQSTGTKTKLQYWDKDLFETRVKSMRSLWTTERIGREWDAMEKDTLHPRRYNGPRDSPLQLRIPAWILGEDYDYTAKEDFQERRMDTNSKGVEMNEFEIEDGVADAKKGFTKIQEFNQERFESRVAMSSVTADSRSAGSKRSMVSFLPEVDCETNRDVSPSRSVAGSVAGTILSSGSGQRVTPSAKRNRPTKVDLVILRADEVSAKRANVTKVMAKFHAQIVGAAKELHLAEARSPEKTIADETLTVRLETALMFLGKAIPTKDLQTDEGTQTKVFDFNSDDKAAAEYGTELDVSSMRTEYNKGKAVESQFDTDETFLTMRLRDKMAGIEHLPVEQINSFPVLSFVNSIPSRMETAQTEQEIELAGSEIEAYLEQIDQLRGSVATAQSRVNKLNKESRKKKAAQQEEAEKKKQQQEKDKTNAASVEMKKQIRQKKVGACFTLDWTSHGVCKSCQDVGITEMWENDMLSEPFSVVGSVILKEMWAKKETEMECIHWVSKFAADFPKRLHGTSKDHTKAPINEKFKPSTLRQIWDLVFHRENCLVNVSKFPSLVMDKRLANT